MFLYLQNSFNKHKSIERDGKCINLPNLSHIIGNEINKFRTTLHSYSRIMINQDIIASLFSTQEVINQKKHKQEL